MDEYYNYILDKDLSPIQLISQLRGAKWCGRSPVGCL